MTDWAERSALSATEIDILSALDFEPAPETTASTSTEATRTSRSRTAAWLAVAYPHLTPQERKIRTTIVAFGTLAAIVSITIVLFGLTTAPLSTL